MKDFFCLLSVLLFGVSAFGQIGAPAIDSGNEKNAARLEILMGKVGRSVQNNLESMFGVAFTEAVRQQRLKADASPKGKPRNFVYESILTKQATGGADFYTVFTRTLKSIDGKSVINRASAEDSKCEEKNPQATYDNPLGFLLPARQSQYVFTDGGAADFEGSKTVVILVAEKPASEPPAIVEKDDCLFLSRPLQMRGKIWVDGKTFDVVQIKWQQAETFSATIPKKTIKTGIVPLVRPQVTITYEKQDTTVSFRRVRFENPEQTLLLPYFSESVWINGGVKLAGMQTRVDYTRYRLFDTNVKVTDADK